MGNKLETVLSVLKRGSRKKFCVIFLYFTLVSPFLPIFLYFCNFPLFSVGRAISSPTALSGWLQWTGATNQPPASLLSKQSTGDTTWNFPITDLDFYHKELFQIKSRKKMIAMDWCSQSASLLGEQSDFSLDCAFFVADLLGFGLFPHNGSAANPDEIWPNFQDHIMRKRD